MDIAVIPECYVDTNLVETLVPPVRRGNQMGYNHQKGCGTVGKVMRERFAGGFALGIIDKDKHEIDYLKQFTVVAPAIITDSTKLILHKHKELHHYIIQICPAMETFIRSCADEAGISIADYGLSPDFERFTKECKREQSKVDGRFTALFRAIRQAGCQEFTTLANWIKHLKTHTYNANLDEVRAM